MWHIWYTYPIIYFIGLWFFGTIVYITDVFRKYEIVDDTDTQIFTAIWPLTLVLASIILVCFSLYLIGEQIGKIYINKVCSPLRTKFVAAKWHKKNDEIYREEQRRNR